MVRKREAPPKVRPKEMVFIRQEVSEAQPIASNSHCCTTMMIGHLHNAIIQPVDQSFE